MIHSFLLIGQSNMAGRGFLNEAADIDSSRIKILRNGRWQPMFRPINPDRAFSGVSLAESFAESYAKQYDTDVGLICCADGGTTLDQWMPGTLLYDNAVSQALLALRTSAIAGILWHQGESDCKPEQYSSYSNRLKNMINSLKKDLNLYDIPILLGGLGDYLKNCTINNEIINYTYVNDALQKTADELEMTGFVSAENLTSNPDNLHFNAKSLYEFGHRYFQIYEKLRNPDKVYIENSNENNDVRNAMEAL